MKNKILGILVFIIILLGLSTITSYASISASSKTVSSGESVTVTVSSSQSVGACTLKLTDAGGLTLSSSSSSSGQANGTSISISSATGVTTLGSYTFKTPTVTSDTNYTVKFTASGMEDINLNSIADSSTTATITVKAPTSTSSNTSSSSTASSSSSSSSTSTTPTFSSVNQTVYAKSKTNVRANYNTTSSVLGSLEIGDSVTRTGIGSNGWSKVTYNGKTAYVYSANLTTTAPTEENTTTEVATDKALKTLTITGVELDPAFDSETTQYSLTVDGNVTELKITAEPNSDKATVKIEGNENLKIGENTIKIAVTAEDGTTRIYVLNVTKQEATTLGLSKLEIAGVSFSPEFSSDVHQYSININSSDVKSLTITALANQEGATVEIIGNENLAIGENIITILVTSADGSETSTYQVIVNKTAAATTTNPLDILLFCLIGAAVIVLILIIILSVRAKKGKKKSGTLGKDNLYTYPMMDEKDNLKDEKIKNLIINNEVEEQKEEVLEEEPKTNKEENTNSNKDDLYLYGETISEKLRKPKNGRGRHF